MKKNRVLKMILIFVISFVGIIIYFVGYKSKLIVELPKTNINSNFSNNRVKHFKDNDLTTLNLKKLMKTDSPKIFVFWTGWCEYSRSFLSQTDSIYNKYPKINFVFVNLDKESNLKKSDSLHLFYNIKNESYRMKTENKFMDFANHKSIEETMDELGTDFSKHPGLPYFIGIDKSGKIITEIAGYENKKTNAKFDKYLADFYK